MPPAVIAFEFDPVVRLAGVAIRLETLGIAAAIAVACVVAAVIAQRTPAGPDARANAAGADPPTLRTDDLVFVLLGAIPGALVGGRLGYGLVHLDHYLARPGALLDPGQGSLELTLGVAGAALTGGYAGRLLTGAAGPWFHAAAVPTLVAIGLGKLALGLGGSGQGLPSDAALATSYVGAGPWGSLAPEIPSIPAQLLEAAGTAVVALGILAGLAGGAFRAPDGRAWLVAVGGWAVVRLVVASTWRDAVVLGPLRAGQLLALGLLLGCAAAAILLVRSARDADPEADASARPADPTAGGSIVTPADMTASRDGPDPALQGSEERT